MTTTKALPSSARTFGAAGLLPQAAAAAVIVAGSPDHLYWALAIAFAYAALIFSFLGGLWWGLAAARLDAAPNWVWPVGVLPSLIALATFLPWVVGAEWPGPSLIVLAAGIAASALVDRRLDRLGLCPPGWLRLRTTLSLALAALTAICALA